MQAVLVLSNQMPLSFRCSRSDEIADTLRYIPGSSLSGGLAASHSRLCPLRKEEFARFFTSGKIHFGNLYPANFESKELDGDTLPVRSLPATSRSCKRFSGFRFNADHDDEERHGVSDHLIPWTLFALNNKTNTQVLEASETCSYQIDNKNCGESITPFNDGFYRHGYTPEAMGISKIPIRVLTRTGISRARHAVSESILYNLEVLEENQKFRGTLHCEDESLWDAFASFLETASEQELIYLGNSRTRGLGKLRVTYKEKIDRDDEMPEQIKQRVITFSEKLKETARTYNLNAPHSLYIPVTLESEVILRDALMRHQTAITRVYLERKWGLSGMEPVCQFVTTRRVMGWNALAKLPRADDVAMAMGSVFLFGYNGAADDRLWKILSDIQGQGIGERREHGFGRVVIADSFHTEVNER